MTRAHKLIERWTRLYQIPGFRTMSLLQQKNDKIMDVGIYIREYCNSRSIDLFNRTDSVSIFCSILEFEDEDDRSAEEQEHTEDTSQFSDNDVEL